MALAARKPPTTPAKPALAKAPAATKPAAGKAATKAAAETKAAPKPTKETKPFESGEVVIFKGYKTQPPGKPLFTESEELAVVAQEVREGAVLLSCVKSSQYHKYREDESSVDGEQIMVDEVRRTGRMVPEPYHLPMVGNMANVLKVSDDPLEVAKDLFSKASEAFFYFGGCLAKLWKEKDSETDKPLFCGYTDAKGKHYENSKEGFEAFVTHNFGTDMSYRKAAYYMSIYENFSALTNAADIIKQLPNVGWWKAGMLAQYVTDANAAELVQIAQEQSSDQLTETLKTSYTSEGGTTARGGAASRATIKRTTMEFKLYEDQGVAVEYILKAAAKQLGTNDMNQVFETIIHQWAADHMADTAQKAEAATKKAQNALKKANVKIPADHPLAAQQQAATA
jgi:hypothetical protein